MKKGNNYQARLNDYVNNEKTIKEADMKYMFSYLMERELTKQEEEAIEDLRDSEFDFFDIFKHMMIAIMDNRKNQFGRKVDNITSEKKKLLDFADEIKAR
ncbi:hypothetical protein ACTHQ2_22765, partial [Bacillus subtilis]|uniref:hypothetical protein n=1 Tax=Bacillus subtilis TaxID=1423 RepID=UPI003F7B9A25